MECEIARLNSNHSHPQVMNNHDCGQDASLISKLFADGSYV
jgi:hypothetical protein